LAGVEPRELIFYSEKGLLGRVAIPPPPPPLMPPLANAGDTPDVDAGETQTADDDAGAAADDAAASKPESLRRISAVIPGLTGVAWLRVELRGAAAGIGPSRREAPGATGALLAATNYVSIRALRTPAKETH
jgi:hypothetical protein